MNVLIPIAGGIVGLVLMSVGGSVLLAHRARQAELADMQRLDTAWITCVPEAPASLSGIATRDAPVEVGFLRRRVPGATLAYFCGDPLCRARHCFCRAPGTEAQQLQWEREDRRRQMAILTPTQELRVFTSIVTANWGTQELQTLDTYPARPRVVRVRGRRIEAES